MSSIIVDADECWGVRGPGPQGIITHNASYEGARQTAMARRNEAKRIGYRDPDFHVVRRTATTTYSEWEQVPPK